MQKEFEESQTYQFIGSALDTMAAYNTTKNPGSATIVNVASIRLTFTGIRARSIRPNEC